MPYWRTHETRASVAKTRGTWSRGTPVRMVNPHANDPALAGARHKWGVPCLGEPAAGGGWHYTCQSCHATWVGPMGDTCSWCHDRWEWEQAHAVAELLYPPWMVREGPRFDELTDTHQRIWRATRGTRTVPWSEKQWAIELEEATASGAISESQAVGALERFDRWDQLRNSMPAAKPD